MGVKSMISIWFFIGTLLLVYGIAIFARNLYDFVVPPTGPTVAMWDLHFGFWWGILLMVVGTTYVLKFRPRSGK